VRPRNLDPPAPAKLRPGYANFAIDDPPLKLVLNSPGNGPGCTINHLAVEVSSAGDVTQAEARLAAAPALLRVLAAAEAVLEATGSAVALCPSYGQPR
jgi:hypothetical protein